MDVYVTQIRDNRPGRLPYGFALGAVFREALRAEHYCERQSLMAVELLKWDGPPQLRSLRHKDTGELLARVTRIMVTE